MEKENMKNSDKMLRAFNPVRTYMLLYGRLPFDFNKREDGTPYLRFSPRSIGSIYFFISSIFAFVIFFMMMLGFVTMFFQVNKSSELNTCKFTWEVWELKKYCVIVSLTATWLLLTVVGIVYLLKEGHVYIHYFNYWFKAVDIMNIDVATKELKKDAIIDNSLTVSMAITFIILYIWGVVPSLNEGSGSVANVLVRLFKQDIFLTDIQKERMVRWEKINKINGTYIEPAKSIPGEYCGPFTTVDSYALWKMFGFAIQIYAIFGSRVFIMQFRFFGRVLKNAVSVWNARLKYSLTGGKEDPTDQTKVRLDLKLLLKDHLILAQLFRMTETCFGLIVQSFYFVQVANVGFQLYFFSQVGLVDTCNAYLQQLKSASSDVVCSALYNKFKEFPGIEIDAFICGDLENSKLPNVLLALTLFVQTILLFTSTTNSASNAYEQAMEGFGIVRRHGFMFTKSRKERNFIHCLVVSYARNNPMILTASGYFTVSRPLTLVVIATVVNYYIILLQFKPGEVGSPCGINKPS